jgi:hypothetical protein
MAVLSRGQSLHERAAGGESLSADERAELDAWYASMDAEEDAHLNRGANPELDVEKLRSELQIRLQELEGLVGKSRAMEARNEQLRLEIGHLKQLLVDDGILAA